MIIEDERARNTCLIEGNAHTFPGRIAVWCEAENASFTISKEDIIGASPEALIWIDGYLSGSEPGISEFLGSDDDLPDDDPRVEQWWHALAFFRSVGRMPAGER